MRTQRLETMERQTLPASSHSCKGSPPTGWVLPIVLSCTGGPWKAPGTFRTLCNCVPNLTLRAGLRDEFTNGWNEKYGRAPQYVPDANGVLTSDPVTSTTHIGKSTFLDNKATRLFIPGSALPGTHSAMEKTSIRAGFGMYYTLLDNLSFQMNFTAPFNTLFAIQNVSLFDSALPPPVALGKPLPPFCGPGIPAPCITPSAREFKSTRRLPRSFVELLHRAATEPQHVSSCRLCRLSRLPQHHRH